MFGQMDGQFSNLKIPQKGHNKEVMSDGLEDYTLLDKGTQYLCIIFRLLGVHWQQVLWIISWKTWGFLELISKQLQSRSGNEEMKKVTESQWSLSTHFRIQCCWQQILSQIVVRLAVNGQFLNTKESKSRNRLGRNSKQYDKRRSDEKVIKYWWGI